MKKTFLIILVCIFMLTGCKGKENRVVIYSSAEEYRNQALIEQVKEKFPNYDVVVQYLATGNNAAKIKMEGTNTEADIILGLETAHMESLKDNFASLKNFDQSIYLDSVENDDKYWLWEIYSAGLIVDKDYFKEKGLAYPTSYEDLLNPAFKGLIAMPDPKTSGTGYMFYLNILNVMGENQGYDYLEKLSDNIKQFTTSGSGPINLLNQGEVKISMGMNFNGADEITKGANYEIVQLSSGTPFNSTSVAIIKGREERQAVKEVFEFLTKEFIRYDKENFVPDNILKEQKNNVKNYPKNILFGDMTGINDTSKKDELIKKWKY